MYLDNIKILKLKKTIENSLEKENYKQFFVFSEKKKHQTSIMKQAPK